MNQLTLRNCIMNTFLLTQIKNKFDPKNRLEELTNKYNISVTFQFLDYLTFLSLNENQTDYIDSNNSFGRQFLWLDINNTFYTVLDDWLSENEKSLMIMDLKKTLSLSYNESYIDLVVDSILNIIKNTNKEITYISIYNMAISILDELKCL